MKDTHIEPLGNGVKIYVSKSYHFSTDTILLADFSMPKSGKKCVDLGTGCGTIPLLWLKRDRSISVDAVELQKSACELTEKSYDVVACNPPYKQGGTGIKNPESAKLIARHESECTLGDICAAASKLLQFGGRFCVCHRPERLADVMESMREADIEPKRLRLVQQRKSKAPKLFLLEGRKSGNRGFLDVLPTLFIEDENGGFSDEMLAIYGDYKS